MEKAAKETAGVKDASVNFMALKMFVEFEAGTEPEKVMKDVLKACRKVEPDCEKMCIRDSLRRASARASAVRRCSTKSARSSARCCSTS